MPLALVPAVTVEGKVYACGEATNGRLGLGVSSGTVPVPRQVTALSSYVVKKVAVHSGTRLALACRSGLAEARALPVTGALKRFLLRRPRAPLRSRVVIRGRPGGRQCPGALQ